MNQDKLAPYLKGFTAPSRAIIFLLGAGYSITEIQAMTTEELQAEAAQHAPLCPPLHQAITQLADECGPGDRVFVHRDGSAYRAARIFEVLYRAHARQGQDFTDLDTFRNALQ